MEKIEVTLIIVFSVIFMTGFISAISINEFELNPDGTDSGNEWIELINLGEATNLSGWYVQDNQGNNFSLPNIILEKNKESQSQQTVGHSLSLKLERNHSKLWGIKPNLSNKIFVLEQEIIT